MLELKALSKLPTAYAEFWLRVYVDPAEDKEQIALGIGEVPVDSPTLLRLHSECLTGDALFSLRCDCGFQLETAMQRIASEGSGLLLYLRQEGRGIGLANKIRAYALQDSGADTVEANEQLGFAPDMRDYGAALEILADLGVTRARLMTNNPKKVEALENGGIAVAERIPMECGRNPHNDAYLTTKAGKLGHLLSPMDPKEDGNAD